MHAHPQEMAIQIRLLGRFEVVVAELQVGTSGWPSTRAAQLVQLLALADGFVLPRDAVIEALWPHLEIDAGAANLRKAAHLARRALDARDAVVLRRGEVALFPQRAVTTDAVEFLSAAEVALASGDADAWRIPAAMYEGDLLPGSVYEEWTQAPRPCAAHALSRRAAPRRTVGTIGRARTCRRTCASGADARRDDFGKPPRRGAVVRPLAHRAAPRRWCAPRRRDRRAVRRVCRGARPGRAPVRGPSARARPRGRRSRSATQFIDVLAGTRPRPRRNRQVGAVPAARGRGAPCRLAPDQYQSQSRLQPVRRRSQPCWTSWSHATGCSSTRWERVRARSSPSSRRRTCGTARP